MTREEQNRKLAEWLGWPMYDSVYGETLHDLRIPDFFTDEAANALLLENFSDFTMVKRGDKKFSVTPTVPSGVAAEWYVHPDRKTAVCLAALAMIDK